MSVFSASAIKALACAARSLAESSAADSAAAETIKNMTNTSVANRAGRVTDECNTAMTPGGRHGGPVGAAIISPAAAARQAVPRNGVRSGTTGWAPGTAHGQHGRAMATPA